MSKGPAMTAVDGTAEETSAPMRTEHAGRLIRKLALLFLIFAAVAVALNCALTFVSTRDAYLESEADRLSQVGGYAATSILIMDFYNIDDEWASLGDELDPAGTFSEALSAEEDMFNELTELADRLNTMDVSVEGEEQYEKLLQRFNELDEQSVRLSQIAQYYSLTDMLDRLREVFPMQRLALATPDDQSETLTFLAEGVGDGQQRGVDGVRAYGEEEAWAKADYPKLWESVENMRPSDALELSPDNSTYLMYVPLEDGDKTWVFVLSVTWSDMNAGVLSQMAGTLGVSCAVLALCLAAMLLTLRHSLVRPLVQLGGRVREYGTTKKASMAGVIRADKHPKDEVGDLATDVANMIDELQEHMSDIARMSAEQERTKSELATATRIQLSALPTVRPPFSGCDDFQLAASMNPAKEVGGDFYDFFLIDERRCGVVIADVSGKGVPAALFMMRAKALINQLMSDGLSPADALVHANDSLCKDNEADMFVTVWLGVLDLQTGRLDFANGGHNPPLYHHADGTVDWLRERSGLLLGSFAGVPYRSFSRQMQPGDSVLLYTDGVTEAMDANDSCYGDDRLFDLVERAGSGDPDQVAEAVRQDVRAFAEGADQADDITMLVLRYDGGLNGAAAMVAGKRG